MDGSIVLDDSGRKLLLETYRKDPDPQLRLRAHILLLLAMGQSWLTVSTLLFCSTATISRWKKRYQRGGLEAVLSPDRRPGRPAVLWTGWAAVVVRWAKNLRPPDFGYIRSRWCCATLALVLWQVHRVEVCPETVRRWLHQQQMVWRRPRPVLDRQDPERQRKLREIQRLLGSLPANEVAFFQDEVDINTNPKIGCMWMPKGEQAQVPTPGDNAKRYLAGSMDWRTGKLVVTAGDRRDSNLFIAHLDDLRRRYRGFCKIHVICDNARFHRPERCRKLQEYLRKWAHRIELHYLPKYAPETNPIERVWWHLHDEVTRNHRCFQIDQLVQMVIAWLGERSAFRIETHLYSLLAVKAVSLS